MFNWYILQVHSGFEAKVSASLSDALGREAMSDCVEQIVIPTESVVEVKNGVKSNINKKLFPGYILIKMKMDNKLLHIIRRVPKVNGFLGNKDNPSPISQSEADRIFKQMKDGFEKPKHTIAFEAGEVVRINDGPFESFVGMVEEIDNEKMRLKVSVSIFGRNTPVELDFVQVTKE